MSLDDKGRCCGRKPLIYKSWCSMVGKPHKFCPRCDRDYDLVTGEQIPNWAWAKDKNGEFVKVRG